MRALPVQSPGREATGGVRPGTVAAPERAGKSHHSAGRLRQNRRRTPQGQGFRVRGRCCGGEARHSAVVVLVGAGIDVSQSLSHFERLLDIDGF